MRKRIFRGVAAISVLWWCGPAMAHDLQPFENVTATFIEVRVQDSFGGASGLPRVTLPPLPPVTIPGQPPVVIPPLGTTRRVLLLRPITPTTSSRVPAMIVFEYLHGRPQDMTDFTQVARLVRDSGIWVLVPDTQDGSWNYGITSRNVTDDASFIAALIDQAVIQYPLDSKRIFVAGFSDGALMVETMACQFPSRIAGGAVVAATIHSGDQSSCKPGLGTPMVFFNGTADQQAPYAGAQEAGVPVGPGAMQVVRFWAGLDGCGATPVGTDLPAPVADGTSVHLDRYGACSNGGPVLQYTINGGGHAWPGTLEFPGELGIVTQNLNATAASWSFFSQLARP